MSSLRKRFKGASINLMYVPALAIFATFLVWPVIQGVILSTTTWDGYSPTYSSAGMSNYWQLLDDPNFLKSLRNTFVYGVGSTILQQVIGLLLAVLLERTGRFSNMVRTIVYLPVLISPVVMGTFYYLIFRYRQGAINDILELFGQEPVALMANSDVAMLTIVLVNSFQFVGISMIIYLSGLQAIPTEVNEAAELDGVSRWQMFCHITWPMLHPAFAASVVINLIGGLKIYDIIKVLTDGGPGYDTNSVSTLIGKTYFNSQSAGYAAAQGFVLFLIIIVFTLLTNWWLERRARKFGF